MICELSSPLLTSQRHKTVAFCQEWGDQAPSTTVGHQEQNSPANSPAIPPQPPLLQPSGLRMGPKEPEVCRACCACSRKEGHGRRALLLCLSHGTPATAAWCHGSSLVLYKHIFMSHCICSHWGNSVPSVPLDYLALLCPLLKPPQAVPMSSVCHNAHSSLTPGNHKGLPCICAHRLPVNVWLLKSGLYSPQCSGEYQGHLDVLSSLFEGI